MNGSTNNSTDARQDELQVLVLYRGRDDYEEGESQHDYLAPLKLRLEQTSSKNIYVFSCREEDHPSRPANFNDLLACVRRAHIIIIGADTETFSEHHRNRDVFIQDALAQVLDEPQDSRHIKGAEDICLLRTKDDLETDGLTFTPGADIDVQDLDCKDANKVNEIYSQVHEWLSHRIKVHKTVPTERRRGISSGPYAFNEDIPTDQDQLGSKVIVKQLKLLIDGWFGQPPPPPNNNKPGPFCWLNRRFPNWDILITLVLLAGVLSVAYLGIADLYSNSGPKEVFNFIGFCVLTLALYLLLTTKVIRTTAKCSNKGQDAVQLSIKILLRGHWGQGKSSILRMLESLLTLNKPSGWSSWLQSPDSQTPLVINFNAWYRQQDPPIWWQLPRQVYQQAIGQTPLLTQLLIRVYHLIWMTKFTVGGVKPFFAKMGILVLVLTSIGSAVLVGKLTLDSATQSSDTQAVAPAEKADKGQAATGQEPENTSDGPVSAKLIPAIIGALITGVLGLIVLTRQEWLEESSSNRRLANASDGPVSLAKAYYTDLVHRLNRPIVVIIDDLDRVTEKDAVEFLQVLHTVFDTDHNLLYLVAADRRWLERSYCRYYEFDKDCIDTSGQDLAAKFMEKLFHVEVPIPQFNAQAMAAYLDHLLSKQAGSTSEESATADSSGLMHRDQTNQDEDLQAIQKKANELKTLDDVEQFARSSLALKYSRDDIAMVLAAAMSQPHIRSGLTRRWAGLMRNLSSNPRQMKRIINNYSLLWPISWGMELRLDSDLIMAWCILENVFPHAARQLRLGLLKQEDQPSERASSVVVHQATTESKRWTEGRFKDEIQKKLHPNNNKKSYELLTKIEPLKQVAEVFG